MSIPDKYRLTLPYTESENEVALDRWANGILPVGANIATIRPDGVQASYVVNIPQLYDTLEYVFYISMTVAALADVGLRFNADAGTNYPRMIVYGIYGNATAQVVSDQTLTYAQIGTTPNSLSVAGTYTGTIAGYSNTLFQKSQTGLSSALGAVGDYAGTFNNKWVNSAAITSVTVLLGGGSIMAKGSILQFKGY